MGQETKDGSRANGSGREDIIPTPVLYWPSGRRAGQSRSERLPVPALLSPDFFPLPLIRKILRMRFPLAVAGLMSGTSLDGVDAAWIRTDGLTHVETGPAITLPYPASARESLRICLGGGAAPAALAAARETLTHQHHSALRHLARTAAEHGLPPAALAGFHGQTIHHAPENRHTWQIGDGPALARRSGLPVVWDFRSADIAAGGQGAPLVPLYHQALAAGLERPLAVLNIGGVANLTWLGATGTLLAFDTGPGNALLDDWVASHTDRPYDHDGALAAAGRIDSAALQGLLAHRFFQMPPPKSLDRNAFDPAPFLSRLNPADGAATLTAFTAHSIAAAVAVLPAPPRRWLVTGGGRHNSTLMRGLQQALAAPVMAVEKVGWNGDALEAQAFAYLAVRSCRGLPLSLPTTTGVPHPVSGGRLACP